MINRTGEVVQLIFAGNGSRGQEGQVSPESAVQRPFSGASQSNLQRQFVDGGVYQAIICGVAPGSATITAMSGQESGTALVTVSGTFAGQCFERG